MSEKKNPSEIVKIEDAIQFEIVELDDVALDEVTGGLQVTNGTRCTSNTNCTTGCGAT